MIVLKILLLILLYIVLSLLGILLLLLISPIKGYVSANMKSLYFKGSYLFGAIRFYYVDNAPKLKLLWFNININKDNEDSESEEGDDKEKAEKKKDKKGKKKEKNFRLPNKQVIVLTLQLVKKLIGKIAPKGMTLHLTLGIDEPYIVEMIHIYSMMIFAPLNKVKHYDIQFIPVHDEVDLDFEGEAKVNFSLMQLILPCLFYILKKPIRQYFGIKIFKRRNKEVIQTKAQQT